MDPRVDPRVFEKRIKHYLQAKEVEVARGGVFGLQKYYCLFCDDMAIVVDGVYLCCDTNVEDLEQEIQDTIRGHRNSLGRDFIPLDVRDKIMSASLGKCHWCHLSMDHGYFKYGRWMSTRANIDHVRPWSKTPDNSPENLVASCSICNALKGDLEYVSDVSTRESIQQRAAERGTTYIETVPRVRRDYNSSPKEQVLLFACV